jgi:predicted transcriptional regulator
LEILSEGDRKVEEIRGEIGFEFLDDHIDPLVECGLVGHTDDMYSLGEIKDIGDKNLCPRIFRRKGEVLPGFDEKQYQAEKMQNIIQCYIVGKLKRKKKANLKGFIKDGCKELMCTKEQFSMGVTEMVGKEYIKTEGDIVEYVP